MIISHKYKFIFIKNQKTAGSSIEAYLSGFCGDDDVLTPDDWGPGRNYDFPFSVSLRGLTSSRHDFMRENWLRLRLLGRRHPAHMRLYNHMSAEMVQAVLPDSRFDDYYKFCVERNPWDKVVSHYFGYTGGRVAFSEYIDSGHFYSDFANYSDGEGNLLVDRVVRFENLNEELTEVFSLLGVPFQGALKNSIHTEHKKRKPYQEYYSREQELKVAGVFNKEIELLGYAFD